MTHKVRKILLSLTLAILLVVGLAVPAGARTVRRPGVISQHNSNNVAYWSDDWSDDWSESRDTGPSEAVSGDVEGWLTEAIDTTGAPMSWLPSLKVIAQHESGGNPNAINNWDSNAKAGHPSMGLMQTIGPTFNAYALPGHKDIWNPVDNAIAAIRYIQARYRSVSNVPGVRALNSGGRYVGY